MKRWLSVLLLVGVSINAGASAPLAAINARLVKSHLLCGDFKQVKQLVGIKKPLASSGRFCVDANQTIIWLTEQPFATTLCVTPDFIIQSHAGQVLNTLAADQEPAVRMINRVLFSLLAGDLSQLDKLFLMQGAMQNGSWQVALKARDANVSAAMSSIDLQGDRFVNSVILQEAEGDRTSITFSNLVTGKDALSMHASFPRESVICRPSS